jgi:uncharacterized membrane protein YjjB (DUF3815 family)
MEYFMTQLTQYYGADWIAMIFTFLWVYSLGNKNRNAFIYGFIGCAAWATYSTFTHSFAGVFANIIISGLNVRGYLMWAPE